MYSILQRVNKELLIRKVGLNEERDKDLIARSQSSSRSEKNY